MDGLLRDLRVGFRALRRSPGFTLVAVLTLALGIGVNSGMFSVINSVLLQPLPYPGADRLLSLFETFPVRGEDQLPAAPRNFQDWREQNRSFEYLAAWRQQNLNLTGSGEPERLLGHAVSADFFRVWGINPTLGRGFLPEEDAAGAARVAVLSHGLWQQRFGGDAAIVGSTISLNGEAHEVIGVMPAAFRSPGAEAALWVTPAWPEPTRELRVSKMLNVVGRLKPGVSHAQARADLAGIAERIGSEAPDEQGGWEIKAVPLHDVVVGAARTPLYVLMGAVAFVLLIACGNVANLFLARAATRRKEMAVRTAIGAPRWALARQLVMEAVILSLAGGFLALLLSWWAVDALAAAAPAALPRASEVRIDLVVVAFTSGVSLLTVLLFSLVPAMQASRPDLGQVIRDGRRTGSSHVRSRLRNALITSEVAVSLLLLVGAGLMLKSFARLRAVDPGFRTENVLTAQVPLPTISYDTPEKQVTFFDQLVPRVAALPGVEAVGLVTTPPLSGSHTVLGVWKDGQQGASLAEIETSSVYVVNAEYFRTLDIPLRRGRTFDDGDHAGTPGVVVISETAARKLFPGTDPLGQRLLVGNPEGDAVEVIGVVGDTKHGSLAEAAPLLIYSSYAQSPFPNMTLMVRTAGRAEALTGAVRAEVRALDAEQPVGRIATMEQLLEGSVAASRFSMTLLSSFAVAALLLALVGIYGVIAYSVTQRTHEFGVQMALGARRGRVVGEVLRGAMRVTGIGIAIGLVAALLVSRVLSGLVFQVSTTDPATYISLALLIAAVAALASLIPAVRAARVDPMIALRAE